MGHTRAQLRHFIRQVSATWMLTNPSGRGVFAGDAHDERVPIGQKEHPEHREDEHHHEQPESERADKPGDRAVGRILREHAVVEAAARAGVAAPPPSAFHGKCDRSDHADQRQDPYDGIESPHDQICQQDPVERTALRREKSVKSFVRHLVLNFLCDKSTVLIIDIRLIFSIFASI